MCVDYKPSTKIDEGNITQVLIKEMYEKWCTDDSEFNVVDENKKVMWLSKEGYEKMIYDSQAGKYVGAGESGTNKWFLWFIDHRCGQCNAQRKNLQKLANKFADQGLKVAVVGTRMDEEISLAYDVYTKPRGFLIDEQGMAYGYLKRGIDVGNATSWIENKEYQESQLRFKAQPILNKIKLFWAYVKKDVRKWHKSRIVPIIYPYIKKYNVTYFIDTKDPSHDGIELQ